jgi:hypothetical protein
MPGSPILFIEITTDGLFRLTEYAEDFLCKYANKQVSTISICGP